MGRRTAFPQGKLAKIARNRGLGGANQVNTGSLVKKRIFIGDV